MDGRPNRRNKDAFSNFSDVVSMWPVIVPFTIIGILKPVFSKTNRSSFSLTTH